MSGYRSEEQKWNDCFDNFDKDQQNYITVETFKYFLHECGLSDELPKSRINQLMGFADRNKDGFITRKEFLDFMMGHIAPDDEQFIAQMTVEEKKKTFSAYRKLKQIALKENFRNEDKIGEYVNVMKNDGYFPIFIPLVSIIEIGFFIYYCVKLKEISLTGPSPINSIFIFSPSKHYEVWRFLTYMLVHAGIEHIAANILFQVVIGTLLEIVHGPIRIAIIYILGVLAGSLGSAVVDGDVPLCGASAGVYALITAYLSNVIMNWSEMNWFVRLIRLIFLSVFCSVDVFTAVYRRYFVPQVSRVSISAHLFGALTGLLVGIVILRNIKKKLHEKWLFWFALCLYVILDFALIGIFFFEKFFLDGDQ